jgi:hypothetical protein
MAEEELVLVAQDDKTVSLTVIPAITPSPTASDAEVAAETEATFRLVVEQSYRSGGADETDTMEDVACRVPVAELLGAGAAAVDRAFEDLLARLDHPTLRREVAPEAREAAARVRARCAKGPGSAAPSSASESCSTVRRLVRRGGVRARAGQRGGRQRPGARRGILEPRPVGPRRLA